MPSDLIDRAKLLETVDLWEQENGGPAYICTTKFRSAIRSAPAAGPDLGRWIAEQRANLGNISTSHDGSADLARWRASHKLINSLEEFIGTQPPPAASGPGLLPYDVLLARVETAVYSWWAGWHREGGCSQTPVVPDLLGAIRAAFAAFASPADAATLRASVADIQAGRVKDIADVIASIAPPAAEQAPTEPWKWTIYENGVGGWYAWNPYTMMRLELVHCGSFAEATDKFNTMIGDYYGSRGKAEAPAVEQAGECERLRKKLAKVQRDFDEYMKAEAESLGVDMEEYALPAEHGNDGLRRASLIALKQIAIKEEVEQLRKQLADAHATLTLRDLQIEGLKSDLGDAQHERESAVACREAIGVECNRVKQERDDLRAQLEQVTRESETLAGDARLLRDLLDDAQRECETLRSRLGRFNEKRQEISAAAQQHRGNHLGEVFAAQLAFLDDILPPDASPAAPEPVAPERPAMLPSREENPTGLYSRYIVRKASGEPVDPRAFYFVLRIDSYGDDERHIAACRAAARKWCEEIIVDDDAQHLWLVARDLMRVVRTYDADLAAAEKDDAK